MTFRQHITAATQCAGQDCRERRQCLRYLHREARAEWASFDIERQRYPGPCIHRMFMPQRRVA